LVFIFIFVFANALSRAPGKQQGGGHPTVSRTRRRDDERVRCARYLLFLFVVYIVVARVVMLFKSILRIVTLVVVILHRFLSFVPGVLERFQVVVIFSHMKAT
jgi:uncharacterized membrane protein required for colicin V production